MEFRKRIWSPLDNLLWQFHCFFSICLERQGQSPYLKFQFE